METRTKKKMELKKTSFSFKMVGYGHCEVSCFYNAKVRTKVLTDMVLVDNVNNRDTPKAKDLTALYRALK